MASTSTASSDTQRRPTLLSSCARAATAAEARYRISGYEFTRRNSLVIALDDHAAVIVRRLAGRQWSGGRFLVFESAVPDDALLRHTSGGTALLSEELDDADTVVMIASSNVNAEAAEIIGDACAARSIMTAGLVAPWETADGSAGLDDSADGVVSALRPNAMVLVVLRNAGDIPEVLSALRV